MISAIPRSATTAGGSIHAGAEIRTIVKNNSSKEGDEVQLYLSGGPGEEVRSRYGFQPIRLRRSESREMRFTVGHGKVPQSALKASMGRTAVVRYSVRSGIALKHADLATEKNGLGR